MFYTGRRISGDEAVRIGLADQLVPQAEVRGAAQALALEIAQSSPLAVLATRETVRRGLIDAVEAATERELVEQDWLRRTEDFQRRHQGLRRTPPARFQGPLTPQNRLRSAAAASRQLCSGSGAASSGANGFQPARCSRAETARRSPPAAAPRSARAAVSPAASPRRPQDAIAAASASSATARAQRRRVARVARSRRVEPGPRREHPPGCSERPAAAWNGIARNSPASA